MSTTTLTPDHAWLVIVEAARKSPNVFIEYVLGMKQARLHKRMQRLWSASGDTYCEVPRGHGKTVQVAARLSHEVGVDPSIRIKLVQQTDTDATKTTRMIRSIVDSERFRDVFPYVRIDKSESAASAFRVVDTRDRGGIISRDPTVEAKGIFGNAGGRADILVGDDVCDLKNSIQKPALREQVKDFWANNWLPMRDSSGGRKPRTIKVGTPYHVDDITAQWRRFHGERGTLYREPVVGVDGPWPEGKSPEYLAEERELMGPIAYGRAYELNPVSSEMLVFNAEWLDDAMYEELPAHNSSDGHGRMVAAIDFAFSDKKAQGDPDWSVCLIGYATKKGHLYVTKMIRVRATFPDFTRQAIRACVAAGVTQAKAEGNGPQKGLVQQFNMDAPFPVVPVNRDTDKLTRATQRQAFVEGGRLHLLSTTGGRVCKQLEPLYDEMTTFPAGNHDDTVDAALDLIDMAQQPRGFQVEPTKKQPGTVARIYE